MKKLFLIILATYTIAEISVFAQANFNVKPKSGSQIVYAISNLKKISFPSTGNILVTKSNGSADTYALKDLRNLNFSYPANAIETAQKRDNNLLLFPNPVANLLNLQLSTIINQTATVEISSIEGKLVFMEQFSPINNRHQVDVSALPKGIYICRVNNGKEIEICKFFKQ